MNKKILSDGVNIKPTKPMTPPKPHVTKATTPDVEALAEFLNGIGQKSSQAEPPVGQKTDQIIAREQAKIRFKKSQKYMDPKKTKPPERKTRPFIELLRKNFT